ncbi:uncharacterized protein GGS22DRAFT_184872 [Annulohypoxylon maeteangense]|uniref:uncharacterized protein n=1 Tax=Annulohypoxylon maeteangense TaxID=1927788 RepID=UPI0020076D43|nr:uncharacterized protein GGS22DRAFT_184872 [Annulohypoxylon maeteangense]KAI0889294.1 hypothetical protein GGS22DRAFT_184872 [Annulohypoxylon maeteangense]
MENSTDSGSKLAALNSATLGAEMPQITLPDGTKVQTGTMGALLINIRTYNEAHMAGNKDKLAQLEEAMRATLPMLDKVGMFDLFAPEEWIQGNNEGRKIVGKLYQQFKSEQK